VCSSDLGKIKELRFLDYDLRFNNFGSWILDFKSSNYDSARVRRRFVLAQRFNAGLKIKLNWVLATFLPFLQKW